MRLLIVGLLIATALAGSTQAQELQRRLNRVLDNTGSAATSDAPGAMSPPAPGRDLGGSTQAADERWSQYREALQSSDPVARSEALRTALADDNVGIRNNALWFALRGRSSLAISIVADPGTSAENLPDIEAEGVTWSEQRTFRTHRSTIRGEVLEGKLRVRYTNLRMPSGFGLSEDDLPAKKPVTSRNCTLLLDINQGERALTGLFRCEGLARAFKARMPFE